MKITDVISKKPNHGTGRTAIILLASVIALTINSGISYAADTEQEEFIIEEVIVTARKRAENLQDVPVAISVLAKDMIEDGNFDQINEYIELIPNTTFSTDSFTSAEISIRGSARSLSDEDPSVGVYRDGIYIGGLLLSTANFYDMEQVEVLRGPQAGLYGRNAVGGALNVTSARPEFDFGGYADVQIASEDRQEYRVAVNIPVVDDRWALRLSGLHINQDEGFNYVSNQDQYLDAESNKSIRLRSLYVPGDNWEFLTTIDYFDVDGGINAIVIAPDAAGGFADSVGILPVPGMTSNDTASLQRNFAEKKELEQLHIFQEINYEMDSGTLTGLASYRSSDFDSLTDNDATNFNLRRIEFDASQESVFAELRFASKDFDRFRFTTGISLIDEETILNNENLIGGLFGLDLEALYAAGVVTPDISAATGAPIGLPIQFLGLTPGAPGWTGELGDAFPTHYINEQDLQSVALFFEGNYALTDEIELWGNLRYTHDEKSIVFAQEFGTIPGPCPVACGEIFAVFFNGLDPEIGFSAAATFENISPGAGINYQVNEDIMTYAKVVTGFKAGGFNSISGAEANIPFDEETTISYEVGAKTMWLDKRFKVNVAGFYQKRKDALVIVTDAVMPINELGVNAGEILNKGLEVEVSASLTEGLRFEIAAGYLDSTFEDFVTFGLDFSGKQVPTTFKYSLSGIVSYHHPLANGMEMFSYVSYKNGWDGYTNHDNFEEMGNPETIDLRLGIKGDTWKLVGFVDNVADNRYTSWETNETNFGGRHWGAYAPGRTYGMQVVYSFD